MILIPEIETVLILVPRAGSTALKNAVLKKYPKAMLLYRHMEADGVPHGYDRWRRVGVCRNPLARLWSLYKFFRDMKQEPNWVEGYAERMNKSAAMPFEEWVLNNTTVFTDPYLAGRGFPGFWPKYAVMHSIPETRKSQFLYLRPDLGVEVFPYYKIDFLADSLKIDLEYENASKSDKQPSVPSDVADHIHTYFGWDLANS